MLRPVSRTRHETYQSSGSHRFTLLAPSETCQNIPNRKMQASLSSHFFISKCQICTLFTSLAVALIVYSVVTWFKWIRWINSFKVGPLFVMAVSPLNEKMEQRLTHVVQSVLLQETDTWPIDFSWEMFPRVSPVIETSWTEWPLPLWHNTTLVTKISREMSSVSFCWPTNKKSTRRRS